MLKFQKFSQWVQQKTSKFLERRLLIHVRVKDVWGRKYNPNPYITWAAVFPLSSVKVEGMDWNLFDGSCHSSCDDEESLLILYWTSAFICFLLAFKMPNIFWNIKYYHKMKRRKVWRCGKQYFSRRQYVFLKWQVKAKNGRLTVILETFLSSDINDRKLWIILITATKIEYI